MFSTTGHTDTDKQRDSQTDTVDYTNRNAIHVKHICFITVRRCNSIILVNQSANRTAIRYTTKYTLRYTLRRQNISPEVHICRMRRTHRVEYQVHNVPVVDPRHQIASHSSLRTDPSYVLRARWNTAHDRPLMDCEFAAGTEMWAWLWWRHRWRHRRTPTTCSSSGLSELSLSNTV